MVVMMSFVETTMTTTNRTAGGATEQRRHKNIHHSMTKQFNNPTHLSCRLLRWFEKSSKCQRHWKFHHYLKSFFFFNFLFSSLSWLWWFGDAVDKEWVVCRFLEALSFFFKMTFFELLRLFLMGSETELLISQTVNRKLLEEEPFPIKELLIETV